ncbi:MAG: transglutaminase-like cysteine peptidase, partial [Acidobacteriota bacterium]
MGTAKIVTNLGHCMYSVEVVKDTTRIAEAKQRCSDGISRAESDMLTAEQDEANAQADILAAGEALTAAIVAANGNAMDAAVIAAQDRQTTAAQALERAQSAKAVAKLKKVAFEKELATYDTVQISESRDIWCADATEDLQPGETVGTVEINQESAQMLIRPAGAAPDSILELGLANAAAATYLNWSMLPGVQRWRPTYRVGTIKEVDYDADTCVVCLDDARSSAQNIKINPDGVECETQKDGPQGFVDFCGREPGHPACQSNGSSTLTYNAALQAKLDAINAQVNHDNTYAYDEAQFGRLEYWEEMPQSGGAGDCEDFALAKYRACLNAGIPASALRLATGKTTAGVGHAWLEVQTDQGNYALDLNTTKAAPSSSLPYSGRAVQADGINWSGKGLLIEDVPVAYMECNAAAFKPADRVVVHFEDSDWSKPRVIGFESEPEHCGDILCVYMDGDVYKGRRLYIDDTTVKASGEVDMSELPPVLPNMVTPLSYMRTFSKPITIDGVELYLCADPCKNDRFIFGSTSAFPLLPIWHDSLPDIFPANDWYINAEYFYLLNPANGKKYTIPIESSGIFTHCSFFNYGNGTFYSVTIEGLIVDAITFHAVDSYIGPDGEVKFRNNRRTVKYGEDYSSGKNSVTSWLPDFISQSGIATQVLSSGTNMYMGQTYGVYHGYFTTNIETGESEEVREYDFEDNPIIRIFAESDTNGLVRNDIIQTGIESIN